MFWVGDFSWELHPNNGQIYLKPNGNRGLDFIFSILYSLPIAVIFSGVYWGIERAIARVAKRSDQLNRSSL